MTHYSASDGDSLPDVAMDVMASGQPVQFRTTDGTGRVEIVTGYVSAVYRASREGPTPDTLRITIAGINVSVGEDWVMVVAEPERGTLTVPEVVVAPHPKLLEQITAVGADERPFVTVRSVWEGGYLLNWPEWGERPGKTVLLDDAQPGFHALSNVLEFIGDEWEDADADRVEFIGTDEAQLRLAKRLNAVTEREWREEFAGYEGDELQEGRNIIVENWHDATETPTECIARLNGEVIMQAGRIPYLTNRIGLYVIALRWINGSPIAWEEAAVVKRIGEDQYVVRFGDLQERGVMVEEIQTNEHGWTRLHRMPISH